MGLVLLHKIGNHRHQRNILAQSTVIQVAVVWFNHPLPSWGGGGGGASLRDDNRGESSRGPGGGGGTSDTPQVEEVPALFAVRQQDAGTVNRFLAAMGHEPRSLKRAHGLW